MESNLNSVHPLHEQVKGRRNKMKLHTLELLPEMMDYARQITEKNSILNKGEFSDKEEPHSKVIDHPKQQHVKLVLGYLHRLTHKQKAQW